MKLALLTLLGILILGFFLAVTAMCLDLLPVNKRIRRAVSEIIYYAIPCIFASVALNFAVIYALMLKDFL